MSSKKKTIIALSIVLVLALGVVGAILFKNSQVVPLTTNPASESGSSAVTSATGYVEEDLGPTLAPTLESDGTTYELKSSVTTFLLLGVDRDCNEGMNGYASYMMLFVLDSEEQTINVIKIPSYREMEIGVYDDDRNLLETRVAPIGMQYAYGESDARSCFITKPLVIEALAGCPVDYHFAITQDGLVDVVDSLGSVNVVLRNDWTDLDPSYEVDATVTLGASDVQKFFEVISNAPADGEEKALNRGDWFMLSLFRSIMSAGSSDIEALMAAADGSYETNVDADMIDQFRGYEMRGSIVASTDSSELEKQIISLFYRAV